LSLNGLLMARARWRIFPWAKTGHHLAHYPHFPSCSTIFAVCRQGLILCYLAFVLLEALSPGSRTDMNYVQNYFSIRGQRWIDSLIPVVAIMVPGKLGSRWRIEGGVDHIKLLHSCAGSNTPDYLETNYR